MRWPILVPRGLALACVPLLLAPSARATEPPSAEPAAPVAADVPPAPAPEPAPSPPPGGSGAAPEADVDYTTRRFEPAGFPLIGGNSDIGFMFGAVGTLSRFADGIKPYSWNMDVLVSTSIKNGPRGAEFVQESYLYNGDLVGYLDGKLRFNPQVQYQRTINMGYFGLGNAASGVVPANYSGPAGRYFEWVDSVTNAFISSRYMFAAPWAVSGFVGYRYMDPLAYADSRLARDAMARNPDGSPVVRGLRPLSIPQVAVGIGHDRRDNEVFPRRGTVAFVAVAYEQGIPTGASVQYGEAQGMIECYRPLGPFVLAARAVADFQFGHVPFYDLSMSGPFAQSEAVGGGSAVRGVPVGRYAGEIKLYGNVELRTMFLKFRVLKQKITLGADALFDTGRSWLDYTFRSPLDGDGIGLKYGVGGGVYILWGQAALFRIDVAYSPDAAAENPKFPVGLYVSDGTMF